MVLHVRLARQDGVLPLVVIQADADGVKVLLQLLELQLTFSQLVKGDPQQAVLVKLADIVKACKRHKGDQMTTAFLRKEGVQEVEEESYPGATLKH